MCTSTSVLYDVPVTRNKKLVTLSPVTLCPGSLSNRGSHPLTQQISIKMGQTVVDGGDGVTRVGWGLLDLWFKAVRSGALFSLLFEEGAHEMIQQDYVSHHGCCCVLSCVHTFKSPRASPHSVGYCLSHSPRSSLLLTFTAALVHVNQTGLGTKRRTCSSSACARHLTGEFLLRKALLLAHFLSAGRVEAEVWRVHQPAGLYLTVNPACEYSSPRNVDAAAEVTV